MIKIESRHRYKVRSRHRRSKVGGKNKTLPGAPEAYIVLCYPTRVSTPPSPLASMYTERFRLASRIYAITWHREVHACTTIFYFLLRKTKHGTPDGQMFDSHLDCSD